MNTGAQTHTCMHVDTYTFHHPENNRPYSMHNSRISHYQHDYFKTGVWQGSISSGTEQLIYTLIPLKCYKKMSSKQFFLHTRVTCWQKELGTEITGNLYWKYSQQFYKCSLWYNSNRLHFSPTSLQNILEDASPTCVKYSNDQRTLVHRLSNFLGHSVDFFLPRLLIWSSPSPSNCAIWGGWAR